MQNKREENENTERAELLSKEKTNYSKRIVWIVLGVAAGGLLIKWLQKFIGYNPPITIKSGSFEIKIRKIIFNSNYSIGLEEDNDNDDGDDDILDNPQIYHKYKHERRSPNYVIHCEGDQRVNVYDFHNNEKCVIKFFFGNCPPDESSPATSSPDILVRGKNKVKVRTKRPLETSTNTLTIDERYISGTGLCAVIYQGGQRHTITFNEDTRLGIDPSPPPNYC